MQDRKWHKFRVGKHLFPTRVIGGSSGRKGALVQGHTEAKLYLENKLGRSLKDATLDHTKYEWIFKYLIGEVPPRIKAA